MYKVPTGILNSTLTLLADTYLSNSVTFRFLIGMKFVTWKLPNILKACMPNFTHTLPSYLQRLELE